MQVTPDMWFSARVLLDNLRPAVKPCPHWGLVKRRPVVLLLVIRMRGAR